MALQLVSQHHPVPCLALSTDNKKKHCDQSYCLLFVVAVVVVHMCSPDSVNSFIDLVKANNLFLWSDVVACSKLEHVQHVIAAESAAKKERKR